MGALQDEPAFDDRNDHLCQLARRHLHNLRAQASISIVRLTTGHHQPSAALGLWIPVRAPLPSAVDPRRDPRLGGDPVTFDR